MNETTFEFTNLEKLHIMCGACYLEAIESKVNLHFQELDINYNKKCIVSTFFITNNDINKLADITLKETGGRIQLMNSLCVVEAKGFKKFVGNNIKEALIGFLVENWYLRIDNKWALSFNFRNKVREILVS